MESHLLKNTTILLGELTSSSHACLEAIHSKRTYGKLKRRLLEKKKEKKEKEKKILITQTSYTYLLPTHSQSFSTYTVFTTTLPCVFPDAHGFQSS